MFGLALAVAIASGGARVVVGTAPSHAAPNPKPILDFQLSFREEVICGFVANYYWDAAYHYGHQALIAIVESTVANAEYPFKPYVLLVNHTFTRQDAAYVYHRDTFPPLLPDHNYWNAEISTDLDFGYPPPFLPGGAERYFYAYGILLDGQGQGIPETLVSTTHPIPDYCHSIYDQ